MLLIDLKREGGRVDGIKDFSFHSSCITIKKKQHTKQTALQPKGHVI